MRSRTFIEGIPPVAFDHSNAVGKAGAAQAVKGGEPIYSGNASGGDCESDSIELVSEGGVVEEIGQLSAVWEDRRFGSNIIFSGSSAISQTLSFSSQVCKKT